MIFSKIFLKNLSNLILYKHQIIKFYQNLKKPHLELAVPSNECFQVIQSPRVFSARNTIFLEPENDRLYLKILS